MENLRLKNNCPKPEGRECPQSLTWGGQLFFYYLANNHPKTAKKDNRRGSRLEEELLAVKTNGIEKRDDALGLFEEALLELRSQFIKGAETNFQLNVKQEKGKGQPKHSYSYIVSYHENEKEERLKVELDDGKQKYSVEVEREKQIPDRQHYELNILYENKETSERLKASYSLRDYPAEREIALQDFTKQLDKTLHIMPKSIMGGVLGYTYLGENFMARRDDLVGDKALMVDVHEAIHTPDEYETRVLTDWILAREKIKYKR